MREIGFHAEPQKIDATERLERIAKRRNETSEASATNGGCISDPIIWGWYAEKERLTKQGTLRCEKSKS